MKAIRCHGSGDIADLTLEDIPSPIATADEVRIRVQACGVGFPDLLIAQGRYQLKPAPPFTLGGEFAGVVVEAGASVTSLQRGDRVAGFTDIGAFAEEMVAPAARAHRVPDRVSMEAAAAFTLNYATAYAGLKTCAGLRKGERLLVLGAAGGIGLAAVELGKLMGASVIAAASSEEKLALCRRYGADETINYAEVDLRDAIRNLTGNRGVDVVIDPVGGQWSEAAFRGMAWRGRHVVLGFAAGQIHKLPLNLPLLKGASMMGISIGELARRAPDAYAENIAELLGWLGDGLLRPFVGKVFPLEDAPQALRDLAARRTIGKSLIQVHAG
ncbi:MAG TPA: NADPH:quinone oxidoreductase family protein [Roseiarcus sp.]|jgi:NADPH2:quinone reductase